LRDFKKRRHFWSWDQGRVAFELTLGKEGISIGREGQGNFIPEMATAQQKGLWEQEVGSLRHKEQKCAARQRFLPLNCRRRIFAPYWVLERMSF
jgi:hypothetical protein